MIPGGFKEPAFVKHDKEGDKYLNRVRETQKAHRITAYLDALPKKLAEEKEAQRKEQERIEKHHAATAKALEDSRAPGGGFVSPKQEVITASPKLTFVAGRATTAVGDMIRGNTTYGITQTKPIYMPEAFKVEKMEGGGGKSMPPPASEYDWKAARRAEIIAAQAAQDKQTQERRLNQAARDAETEAVEAEKRARRVNTPQARAKAAQALEKAKKAQEAAKAAKEDNNFLHRVE